MTQPDSPGPDGVLVVDKPDGPTSHDVVDSVRRALGTRRVGHAGTLDPFATGVLVVCVGRATRLAGLLSGSDKAYEGVIRFGFATDTGDRTGAPLGEPRDAVPDVVELARLAEASLTGALLQVPPMFSAKKQAGVALYRLARRGAEVPREAVRVAVSGWRLESLGGPLVRFEVTCSAGTYVRVLAADLGALAGHGAHLESLRRTRSGAFDVSHACDGARLGRDSARAHLVPIDEVPLPIPDLALCDEAALAFRHGRRTEASTRADGPFAVRDPGGRLLGLGRVEGGTLAAEAVLLPA